MKNIRRLICAALLLLGLAIPAAAQQAWPEELIDEALLSTMPPALYTPDSEVFVQEHILLGSETKGERVYVYLSASVGGYGFEGGALTLQSGWGGPVTVVLSRRGDVWAVEDVLEVESYVEIPEIMPQWAEDAFFSGEERETHGSIEQKLRAYLDGIGRTEPIRSYAEVAGELSGMLVSASNLRTAVDEAYPLTCTTQEKLEGQERYLYTRSWTPSADFRGDEQETGGTTGVETLIKTRKSDGRVMETMTVDVELDRVSITLADDSGSAQYVFPFDGETYRAPTVTRTGDLRASTARLERLGRSLPGDQERVVVGTGGDADERFAVVADAGQYALTYSRREGDAWREIWRNAYLDALGAMSWFAMGDVPVPGVDEPAVSVEDRHEEVGYAVSLYAAFSDKAEHEDMFFTLRMKAPGTWAFSAYDDPFEDLYARLFDDCTLFYAERPLAMSLAGLTFDTVTAAGGSRFDPDSLVRIRDDLEAGMHGAPEVAYFAGAEPLYIRLGKKGQCPVYVAPDAAGPRAAKGKAAVSLREWVVVLCEEDGWLMVLYETGEGRYRTGFIDPAQDAQLMRAADFALPARFEPRKARVVKRTALFDDPINGAGEKSTLRTLSADTAVTVLADDLQLGDGIIEAAYVQVEAGGDTWRGFVEKATLCVGE